MARVAARGPYDHHHLIVQPADGLPADFAIVEPVILDLDAAAGKDVAGVFEV